jgi:hypothetical protein
VTECSVGLARLGAPCVVYVIMDALGVLPSGLVYFSQLSSGPRPNSNVVLIFRFPLLLIFEMYVDQR